MNRETNTPQIPQVTEANVLEVLRACKEILEVREGRRGDAMDEAVTYRDLVRMGLVRRTNTGAYGDNTGSGDDLVAVPDTGTTVPDTIIYNPVEQTLDGIDRLIARSPLLRDLRTRIEAVESGTWVPSYINDVVVQSESVARESRTLISRVNGSQSAVQQVMEATDGLKAKYTVKVDVNGKVAGFGLAAYQNEEGLTTTEFGVVTDRFFIVPSSDYTQEATPAADATELLVWFKPSTDTYYRYSVAGGAWTAFALQSPFVVLTKATVVDGVTVQPGVYMRNAFIQSLTVDKLAAGTINVAVSLTAAKLLGGQFTAYAWPTTAGGGYYLGPEGLLLGTNGVVVNATTMVSGKYYRVISVGSTDFTTVGGANSVGYSFKATGTPSGTGTVVLESFFQVTSAGQIHAPGFSVVDGVLTIAQINVIGTSNVQPGAITSRNGATLSSNFALTFTSQTVLSATVSTADNPIWISAGIYCRGAETSTATIELWVGGALVQSTSLGTGFWDDGASATGNVVYSFFTAGSYSGDTAVEIRALGTAPGGVATFIAATSNIFAISTKR